MLVTIEYVSIYRPGDDMVKDSFVHTKTACDMEINVLCHKQSAPMPWLLHNNKINEKTFLTPIGGGRVGKAE